MKNPLFLIIALGLNVSAFSNNMDINPKGDPDLKNNPLLMESTLPYSAPDFRKIEIQHFKPAIMEGMRQQQEAIEKITSNTEPPTFDNTVLMLEKSGQILNRATKPFYALTGAHTNKELQDLQSFFAPKMSEHTDAIYLNEVLFSRINSLYESRSKLKLDNESLKLLENYYEEFKKAGASLSEEEKDKLKELNSREASLSTEFNQILLEANKEGKVFFNNKEELKGLSESQLKSIQAENGMGWEISLLNTTQQPLLKSLENRESRKKLFMASWNRTDNERFDTKKLVEELVILRAKKAQLLGYENYAMWSLQNTMAKTPENVMEMFQKLIPSATAKAQEEASEIQKMIYNDGGDFKLEPWDWDFYAEKVRQEKYDLDDDKIKPFFELTNVLENGVFYAATKLYGIKFNKRTDIPTYHEDVVVYELFEEDGTPLGLFYGDFYARPSKRGGAWMSSFVTPSKLYDKKPVIYNVCNYPKPAEGEPALLTYDEVETMFHEFGHALHGFFAEQMYPSLAGTAVARDFVEFPSQFNENWALHPEVLKNYAVNQSSGEQIPEELIKKIKNSSTFNQGYSLTENLAASNLDMMWHTLSTNIDLSSDNEISFVNDFEKQALTETKLNVVNAVPPRYRSTYFAHVFGGGYAAGYYSYLWTEMLHHDAYNWFENNGGMTRRNGQRIRDMILSRGNTMDYDEMYSSWKGSEPNFELLLKARGITN